MKIHRFVLILMLLAGTQLMGASLPEFTGQWVQGGPFTTDGLKGKAVVLYFYEEGCPSCRGKWPGIMSMTKQFENEPVQFIAVNSGNAKSAVSTYVSSVKCDWPAYVDLDRSYEKNFGFEISLQNIYQTIYVDAHGNTRGGGLSEEGVKKAVSTASWKIPPTEIPEPLKKAWRALEFGQTSVAAPLVKQASKSSDAKVKEAAGKLEAVIQADITKRLTDAKTNNEAGKKWDSYKGYAFVAENYKDYAEAKPAVAEIGKLRSDKVVARELQAKGMLDKCIEWSNSPKNNEREQGKAGLTSLAANFADTEAGATAKTMSK